MRERKRTNAKVVDYLSFCENKVKKINFNNR